MNLSLSAHRGIAQIDTHIEQGETVTLTKYTVFSDSIRHEDYKKNAISEMEKALSEAIEILYAKQTEYLDNFWRKCFLQIDGDYELDLAVRYNMYQLLQSVSKDEYGNIAAKGLSGEGYEGHYFWDTEMYIQPFFTLTQPQITRNLISYRYKILDKAREHARIMGHKKVHYIHGEQLGRECSGYFPSGSAQYHINGDIALFYRCLLFGYEGYGVD